MSKPIAFLRFGAYYSITTDQSHRLCSFRNAAINAVCGSTLRDQQQTERTNETKTNQEKAQAQDSQVVGGAGKAKGN